MQLLQSYFLLMFGLMSATLAAAQFNDSTHYYLGYSSTGIINKTEEKESFLLRNVLGFRMKKKKVSFNSTSSFVYGTQNKELSNRDLSTAIDFDIYPKSRKFYYWGLVNYDKSYSLNIVNRIQTGAGIAYRFFDDKKTELNLSDGILYEKSEIRPTDSTRKVEETARNSFRLRYKFTIKDIIVFNGTNLFQHSLKDGQDYILNMSNSVSIKLKSWLSLSTSFVFNKVTATSRENLLLTFGLNAETYF